MKAQIGLFGFGVVGQGFYHILAQKNGTAPGRIARICVRTRGKKRALPEEHFTYDPEDILGDPAITHIIELTDRPDDAFRIVETALKRGKTVISANKKMLSEKRLTASPLILRFDLNEEQDEHELTMVAENLGTIPPNTSLMIVEAGTQRFEVRITSTEQKNAVVKFRYQKPG